MGGSEPKRFRWCFAYSRDAAEGRRKAEGKGGVPDKVKGTGVKKQEEEEKVRR
jgi:hypothetical protein